MVFSKLVITIVLMLVLFFFIYESVGASYSSGSHIDGHDPDINTSIAHEKVNLSVYYNSFSKPCASFIVKDLRSVFYSNLISIVNLQLVPWANAYVNNNNNSISCQNGPDECELNSVESCALNIWSKVDIQYSLISCFEFMAIDGRSKKWQDCMSLLGLPKKHILNCFNAGHGTELGKTYIKQTAQLFPRPSFVPWVVVNDKAVGKDYANFTYYVCKAYRGKAVPKACNLP